MTFFEALKTVDFDDLIDRLNGYAAEQLYGLDLKKRQGSGPDDLVAEVLRKASDGTRKWPSGVSVQAFLWETVRSEVDSFIKKNKKVQVLQKVGREPIVMVTPMIAEEKTALIDYLKAEGADNDEIYVFECWLDGIFKPSQVAGELEMDVDDVNKIRKRLDRKLKKIQQQ